MENIKQNNADQPSRISTKRNDSTQMLTDVPQGHESETSGMSMSEIAKYNTERKLDQVNHQVEMLKRKLQAGEDGPEELAQAKNQLAASGQHVFELRAQLTAQKRMLLMNEITSLRLKVLAHEEEQARLQRRLDAHEGLKQTLQRRQRAVDELLRTLTH